MARNLSVASDYIGRDMNPLRFKCKQAIGKSGQLFANALSKHRGISHQYIEQRSIASTYMADLLLLHRLLGMQVVHGVIHSNQDSRYLYYFPQMWVTAFNVLQHVTSHIDRLSPNRGNSQLLVLFGANIGTALGPAQSYAGRLDPTVQTSPSLETATGRWCWCLGCLRMAHQVSFSLLTSGQQSSAGWLETTGFPPPFILQNHYWVLSPCSV